MNAYERENTFAAALMEGKIRVKNNDDPNEVVNILPNSRVILENGDLVVSKIPDYDVYRWKEGLVCFKDLGFMELMNRIEKYYDVSIVIQNPDIQTRSFSGKFRISDGIDYILRVLQRDVNFTYERSEEGNEIFIK